MLANLVGNVAGVARELHNRFLIGLVVQDCAELGLPIGDSFRAERLCRCDVDDFGLFAVLVLENANHANLKDGRLACSGRSCNDDVIVALVNLGPYWSRAARTCMGKIGERVLTTGKALLCILLNSSYLNSPLNMSPVKSILRSGQPRLYRSR